MRINAHAHVFNLRAVFTRETLQILIDRIRGSSLVPETVIADLEQTLRSYLAQEIDSEDVFRRLDDWGDVSENLNEALDSLSGDGVDVDVPFGDLLSRLSDRVTNLIRERLLAAKDLTADGQIKSDWLDLFEFLRIALLPSVEQVADNVMKQLGDGDGLVALMMDITAGTDDDRQFRQQMKDTSDVILAYPGRLFAFVKVNPARTNHFELMVEALEKHGFWGVKLYPSLGYSVNSPEIRRVLRYCAEHDVPVLTHCNDGGFKRSEDDADFASPVHWEAVLEDLPELRVCFGHFGGSKNMIFNALPADSWTQKVLELMEKPNVFADISYHADPILGNDEFDVSQPAAEQHYFQHLQSWLSDPRYQDRILYGSDYWLVRRVAKTKDYEKYFKDRLTSNEFDRVSSTNPARFLGLPFGNDPVPAAATRHLDFFDGKKMKVQRAPAAWLRAAAQARWGGARAFVEIGTGPTWSSSNGIHIILFHFLGGSGLIRQGDRGLSFEEIGRLKVPNLSHWDFRVEPDAFEASLTELASNLDDLYTVSHRQQVDRRPEFDSSDAVAQLRSAFRNEKWYLYEVADLCDKLYVFHAVDV